MGHCISKCIPSSNHFDRFEDDRDLVQDKLVISQAPSPFKFRPPSRLGGNKNSPHPSVSSSSSSSKFAPSSLFTTAAASNGSSGGCSSSSCSLSSTASSGLSSKGRSFSNDFLLSCIKENPQILRINSPIKASNRHHVSSSPDRIQARGAESPARQPARSPVSWQLIPKKMPGPPGPVMQKRVRSSSPNLTRQKSMRVTEPTDGLLYSHSLPGRILRSPSPSRRFEGADRSKGTLPTTTREADNSIGSMSSSIGRRKEHIRPASPNNNPIASRLREPVMSSSTRESSAHQVEEIASKFSLPHNVDSSSDDINNPLISLDCFIFL